MIDQTDHKNTGDMSKLLRLKSPWLMCSPLHDVCLVASHSPAFSFVGTPPEGAAGAGLAVAASFAHSFLAPAHAAHSALTERPAAQCPAASASAPANMRNKDITLRASMEN